MEQATGIKALLAGVFASCVLFVAGCGGSDNADTSSPTSSAADIIVVGKVVVAKDAKLNKVAAFSPSDALTLAAGDPIEVTVQEEPSIITTVGADGTFTLRGLPAGSFTLIFTQAGVVIGTLVFDEVAPNQQITINVQVVADEVVLVDEDRRGIGHSGIELEGLVQNVVTLNLTGDSTFVIAGRTVIARPGVTAIRQGNTRKTVEDVTVGLRVHVKGALIEGTVNDVLAYEIKIQSSSDPADGTGGTTTICHIPPGKPTNRHTITVGSSAWPAHQAHGDTLGPC